MEFSVVLSPETLKRELHDDPLKCGSVYLKEILWSNRDARIAIEAVSARPRALCRSNWNEPRGPKKLAWLVLNLLPRPIGGIPGIATVTTGIFPLRGITSRPPPTVTVFCLASCTLTRTSSSVWVLSGRNGLTLGQSQIPREERSLSAVSNLP